MKYEHEPDKEKKIYKRKEEDDFDIQKDDQVISNDEFLPDNLIKGLKGGKKESKERGDDSRAPWLRKKGKNVNKVLIDGGDYMLLRMELPASVKEKKKEDYTGLNSVYGDGSKVYRKPFKEEFQTEDNARLTDALFGNEATEDKNDTKKDDFIKKAHHRMMRLKKMMEK